MNLKKKIEKKNGKNKDEIVDTRSRGAPRLLRIKIVYETRRGLHFDKS